MELTLSEDEHLVRLSPVNCWVSVGGYLGVVLSWFGVAQHIPRFISYCYVLTLVLCICEMVDLFCLLVSRAGILLLFLISNRVNVTNCVIKSMVST